MESTADQVREHIVRPVIRQMAMWSEEAEDLVLGTAAQESGFRYIHQLGAGPALSWWQIEPATHNDVWQNSMPGIQRRKPEALATISRMVPDWNLRQPPAPNVLLMNIGYACAMCRLCYWRAPAAIPKTLEGQAAYWKRYYNTIHGKGTEAEYLENWERYCA